MPWLNGLALQKPRFNAEPVHVGCGWQVSVRVLRFPPITFTPSLLSMDLSVIDASSIGSPLPPPLSLVLYLH